MHISKVKLPFYPPCEIKCRLQNGVSTVEPIEVLQDVPLDESNPVKFTRIETSMEEKTK